MRRFCKVVSKVRTMIKVDKVARLRIFSNLVSRVSRMIKVDKLV